MWSPAKAASAEGVRDGKAQLIAGPGPYQGSDRHLRFVAGEYLDMIVFGNRPRMADATGAQCLS